MKLAYVQQHTSMYLASSVVQRALRRVVMGRQPAPGAAHLEELKRRFHRLLAQDFAHAVAGTYPMSLLFSLPVAHYVRQLPRLAADLPRVFRRMKRRDYKDLPEAVDLREYPPYYRRTFHWQSDGYLSRKSAQLYDVGVELLFGGTADVMRRQILAPIVAHARRSQSPARILDVACGTGRALAQLRTALPDADYEALDLSRFYLDEARERLGRPDNVRFIEGNAERLPQADASFDVVFSVFLFHELPRNARRNVLAEMLRVVAPGGLVVIEDSIQRGDAAGLSFFAERFSEDMHEPFYRDYLADDLSEAMREVGLEVVEVVDAFLSKVVVARRPPPVLH
jgi:ubiquinone/menaquinone biosynthesis C-methylase UbiE